MKILQVCPIFPPLPKEFGSGVTQVVYNISKELVKRGHKVEVYTSNALDLERKIGKKTSSVLVDGIKVNYFPYIMHYYTFFLTPSVISAAKRHLREFDIIHTNDFRVFQSTVVHYYARKYGVPYVLQAHGSLPRIMAMRRLKLIYDVFFGYGLLKDASKVIALSRVEAEQYRGMGVPEEKIAMIPNGIDLSEYADLPSKGSFKKKFGIEEDEKIVLYLGRIHRTKGIDILVKAFANIVEKLHDAKLVVVGPDDGYLGELKALIETLDIGDNVLVTGPLYSRDKHEAYVDADVYVLPSRYEIWGMTVLEAVACGAPVIITENCGVAEYFKDTVGLVVKPDLNHLHEALIEMLLDHDKQNTFRDTSKSVIKKFEISRIASKLEEVYSAIMARAHC